MVHTQNHNIMAWTEGMLKDLLIHGSGLLVSCLVLWGCIQRHLRKTYFYTCESGGKESCVIKLQATGPVIVTVFNATESEIVNSLIRCFCLTADSWSPWAFFLLCVSPKSLICEGKVINSAQLTKSAFSQQYEVKRNWIFVPSATASSSDHNKETEDKPPKTSKVATPKTREEKKKRKGSLQGFKTQEVTKSWNDQRRRTSAQLKRRWEAILCPSIFWEDNWSETRSLCLLNSFDKAHVPTLLLALLILTTPPTHHRGVEWAAIC